MVKLNGDKLETQMAKKSRAIVNKSIRTVTWPFLGNSGEKRDVVLHLDRVSAENLEHAGYHGFVQKGNDSMALSAEKFGGRVPEEAKRAALVEIVAHLESGSVNWNMVRQSGGAAATVDPRIAYLVRAFLAAYAGTKAQRDEAGWSEWLKDKTTEEKSALTNNPKFKGLIDGYIAAETAHIDSDSMLAGLEEDGDGESDETDESDTDEEEAA